MTVDVQRRETELGATLQRARAQARLRGHERIAYRAALALMLAALLGTAVWNAYKTPSVNGYDAETHQEYARALIEDDVLPGSTEGSYKPPGFYAVAGYVHLFGEEYGVEDRYKPMLYVNVAFVFLAALLVLALARLLWPARPWLHVATVAFFALVPPVLKTTTMYHPGTLGLLLSTAALYLGVRMIVRRSFGLPPSLVLSAVLLLGVVVQPHILWTYVAVLLALVAAAFTGYAPRRAALGSVLVILLVTSVVAAPVYVTQAIRKGKPVLGLPRPATNLLESRPASFYTELGLPDVFTEPYRPKFINALAPTVYTELWGDYFGIFAWGALTPPEGGVKAELRQQSGIGVLPTLLAFAGWLALLARSLRRRSLARAPAFLAVAVLPLLGLLGFLYYAISYPTGDGDTIKATFMLTTAPAWACAFALALGWALRSRLLRPTIVVFLVGSAVLDLRFLIVGDPLGGLL